VVATVSADEHERTSPTPAPGDVEAVVHMPPPVSTLSYTILEISNFCCIEKKLRKRSKCGDDKRWMTSKGREWGRVFTYLLTFT